MSKITLSRIYETSRALSTKAGKDLADFIQYMVDHAEQSIRALRNGLTLTDNMNAKVLTVSLTHDTLQVINTDGKTPLGIVPLKALSTTSSVDKFLWYVNAQGQVTVKVGFSPTPTAPISVTLVIFFA